MRDALYADVAPWFVGSDGVIRAPAGHGRLAWVARADVARLAAVLLTEPGHEGQIYDVSGPHAIDLHETARILTRATRRVITYHPETLEEARESRTGRPRLAHQRLDRLLPDAGYRRGLGDQSHHRTPHRPSPDEPVRVPPAEPQSFAHLLD